MTLVRVWSVLACVLLFLQVGAAEAQPQPEGGGARALDAPRAPGGVASQVEPAPPPAPEPAPTSAPDPHPRRGLAGIIVGWSGLGAAVASLAMMATCDPLFRQAGALIDTDEYPEVEEDVDTAVHDGTRVCRTIYGAFAGAAGGMAVLGLPLGYGLRHRHRRRLAERATLRSLELAVRPLAASRGGMLWLRARFP